MDKVLRLSARIGLLYAEEQAKRSIIELFKEYHEQN
jgi:hypothetical protein